MIEPGKIKIIDQKVYFEPDGLEKPKRADYYSDVDFYIHDLEKYEASKQSVEVSNENCHVLTKEKELQWILLPHKDKRIANWRITKDGQPCKAEVNGKATIIELTK